MTSIFIRLSFVLSTTLLSANLMDFILSTSLQMGLLFDQSTEGELTGDRSKIGKLINWSKPRP